MTFKINKEYSKSTIKAPRNSAKICTKLTKTSKRQDKHCHGILVVKLDRSHTNFNASKYNSSIYVERKVVWRVDVQLFFKNVRRNKKVYTKCKSKKITEADSAPLNRS